MLATLGQLEHACHMEGETRQTPSHHESPCVAGSVEGLTLRARGVLLEHRAAAVAVEEARAIARLRVRVPAVRDYVVDHSAPGSIWIISDGAWYR